MSKSKDNCTFYNKYFLDDLESYDIVDTNGLANIKYLTTNQIIPITVSPDLTQIIQQGYSESNPIKENIWYPIFVDKTNNKVKNKFLFRGSAANNLVLGVDQAITFNGIFKNWNISGSSKMCVDWIVNSQLPAYLTEYGLLCWIQKSSYKAKALPIDDIPVGAAIRFAGGLSYRITIENNRQKTIRIDANHYLIKLDKNKLQIFNNQESLFQNNQFNFVSQDKIFDISQYLSINFPKGQNEKDDIYENRIKDIRKNNLKFYLNIEGAPGSTPVNFVDPDTIIYIPKGDVHSYYEDTETKALLGLPSLTYVSSTLHAEYREIMNLLTIDSKKEKISTLNQAQYRLLQKVAKFLCSHPLVDRTTISILLSDQAKTIIKNYIDSVYASIELELYATKIVLKSLSELFVDLTARTKNNKNISGYCFNYSDLAKNLMSKYDTYLNIDTPTTLIYKPGLKYGPHVKVNQNIISKASITANNTILYNNFRANIGPYIVESAISQAQTYFSIKDTRSNTPNSRVNIPLWDIKKKNLLNSKLVVTAGSDFIIQYGNTPIGTEIVYPMEGRDLGEIEGEILENEKLQVLWSKISGPDCLRFSDANLTTIRNEDGTASGAGDTGLRFEESTDARPTLYIKRPGRYILRLKIITLFGVFYDRVTVYVVNSKGEYEPGKTPRTLAGANLIEIKPTNGLVVICPNLREFAFGKQGVFWPTYSDLNIYDEDSNPYGTVASFGGYLKKYKLFDSIISNDPCQFSLFYNPNNTTIQISRIILSHMMDNNPDCYNCPSFFQNIVNNKGFTIDVSNTFTLENPETNSLVEIDYPEEVSTDRTKIVSYGNHNAKTITDLGVSIPFHPATGTILPVVSGLEISLKNKTGSPTHLCHLKNVDNEKSIVFEKGCFHPASGWLVGPGSINSNHIPYQNSQYTNFINKTSVINFTPDRRKTFKFKGPGFSNINNLSAEKTNIQEINNPNTYFSTIVLGLEPEAQDSKVNSEEAAISQEAKEIDDHQRNLGYRSAEGSKASTQAINTDEFRVDLKVEPDGATPSSDYCVSSASSQNYQVSYRFPRSGPYLPEQMRTPFSRYTRDIADANIEDIEVQIDFMNYVNTKNLIIWLDVLPCSFVTTNLYPTKASDIEGASSARDRWFYVPENIHNSIYTKSYNETKTEINNMEEGPLKRYLKALFEMNDNPSPEETVSKVNIQEDSEQETVIPPSDPNLPKSSIYRIYLLNQEHVEGNRFNFSLKFTDNIDKHTQPFDNNHIFEDVDPTLIKSVEKDGVIHLLPTLSAFGYTDNDINFFRQIIQSNNLHTLNNRFKKFAGMPLFLNKDQLAVGDTTQFTLGISVINQSDSMEIIDNINNLDSKNAIDRTIDNIRPTLMDNSTCCWYLILHINNNGTQRYLPTDILGNINYDAYEPTIYGYNFIASFDDKKYLLPPINLNAPYAPVLDPDVCKYAKESLNRPKFEQTPFNILPIILVGIPTNGAGAIVEAGNVDAQGDQLTKEIIDFFGQVRRSQQSENFTRSLHVPKYDKYPFGGPDKVLLSISKDRVLWYKLEASIFRYANCPIVKKRRLGYLKLSYKTSKGLSIFPFGKIDQIKDLINADDIKIVSIPLESPEQLKTITQESLQTEKQRLVAQAEALQRTINNLKTPNEELNRQLSELQIKISLYDETIYSIGVKIRKFNLIQIKKTITKEKTETTPEQGYNLNIDGLYLIQEDLSILKILVDQPGIFSVNQIINQLRKNSILDFNLVLITNTDPETRESKPVILQNQLISIQGLRAFYFFDKNDSIITIRPISEYLEELRNSGGGAAADAIEKRIEELKKQLERAKQQDNKPQIKALEEQIWNEENLLNYNTIIAKGYIYDGKSHKTIIELASPIIGNSITIAPENSNTILVYDQKYATIQDDDKQPYNKWTQAETSNSIILKNKTQEQLMASTFGEGSYGTGSLAVSPKILPFKSIENEIESLSDQISIRNSFDLRSALVDIYFGNGATYIQNTPIRVMGYNYTHSDNEFIKNNTPGIDLSTNKIAKFFNKNYSYIQNTDNMAFINVKSEYFKNTNIPQSGEIVFSIDTNFKLPTDKLSASDLGRVNTRLALLLKDKSLRPPTCDRVPDVNKCFQNYWNSINPETLYINDLYLYLDNVSYTDPKKKADNEKRASLRLQNMLTEVNSILYYCDIGEAIVTNPTGEIPIYRPSPTANTNMVLPLNKILLSTEADGSLLFAESGYARDDYWINIDPEQGCSFDMSEIPKVLLSTKYVCEQLNDFISLDMQNICPVSMRNPDTNEVDIAEGIDENFKYNGNTFTYTPSNRQLAIQFAKYTGVTWPPKDNNGNYDGKYLYEVRREFFINAFGKERNQLVQSTETYLLPILPDLNAIGESLADGNLFNKVKDIFNLDSTDKLHVKFKRIPRKLRKYDPYYDRYIPNYLGELTKSLIPGPGGPVDTTLQFWHCIDYITGQYVDIPKYFKLLNEMIYRAYYGSSDAVEHSGRNLSESKETFDWIPYDYV